MKKLLPLLLIFCLLIPQAGATILPAEGSVGNGWRAYVLCESLSVCDQRDGKRIATLQYGDSLIVTESWDGWAACEAAGVHGWVRSDYIAVDPAFYLTDDETPVYAWGNTLAPRVALLDPGVQLPILLENDNYVVVSLRGAAGWIKKTPRDTISQTYFRPEMLQNITYATLVWQGQRFTLTDGEKLSTLSAHLTNVEDKGAPVAGCPFGAQLTVTAGNETFTLDLAVDSCCIYRIDNRDYAYARQMFTGEGAPDNTVLFSLFGVTLW